MQQFDPSYSSTFFEEIRRWKFGSAIFWSIVYLIGQILVWNLSFYITGGSSKGSTVNLNTLLYIAVFIVTRVGLLFYQYQLSTVKISDNKMQSIGYDHTRARATQSGNRHFTLIGDVLSVLLLRWIDASHIVFVVMQSLWGLLTSIAFMQIASPSNYSEDMSSLFVKCNSIGGTIQYTCINEQYLMILCYGIFNGIIYSSIYLINREYQLHFPSIIQTRWVRFRGTIGRTLYNIFKISIITIPLFYLIYIPLSAQLFNYCLSFLTRIGIDSTYTLESISQVDIVTTVRLFLISLFLGASFYFPNHIYEIIHTQLFQFENNGTSYLLDALSNISSPFILYLAYLDLHYLSHWNIQRRSYFYGDTTGDSWKRLLNLICDRVDSISTSIYKIKQKKDFTTNNNNLRFTSGSLGSLQRKLDNVLMKNQVENPLEDLQLYIWAIESVSTMVCTSIKEDRYGVVQNCDTIPILLNSLLSCLSAVEDYLNSPINMLDSQNNNNRIEGYQLVRQPALVLVSVLNNSIYMIVTSFYENLSYFKLPPKHALKLQQFVNFKE